MKTKSELIMNGVRIDTERIEIIEKFWQDPGVKDCFARRNEFQLTDSASYFLDNARRITNDDFEPTNEVFLLFIIIVKPKSKSPIPCPNRPQILTLKTLKTKSKKNKNPILWTGADTIITWATTPPPHPTPNF